MALTLPCDPKRRNHPLEPCYLRSYNNATGWAEITCWCALRVGWVRAGVRGASAAERRPVYGGESATPCLPRSAPLPFCAHSYPPAPLDAREPPARTKWQHRMQTCFVNGCGSDRGRARLSVFFYNAKLCAQERDRNGGATCYRLPLAAFFHAENEARLLRKAAYTSEFLRHIFFKVNINIGNENYERY